MKYRWFKKKTNIKEPHRENTQSVDDPRNDQSSNDAPANLKSNLEMNEKRLLNALKLHQETIDTLIAICNIMKKTGREKRDTKDANGEFINYEEKKKYENMPPIATEDVKSIDWDQMLKK